MGVDYRTSVGYGFVVPSEDMPTAIRNYYSDHDEDFIQEQVDDHYTALEDICADFGFQYNTAGNAWSGEMWYLIGTPVYSTDSFKYNLVTFPTTLGEQYDIKRLRDRMGVDSRIGFYYGMLVY